jgi:hypothetical protein
MIWHIFKKDLKLLWPMAVGVALVHFALAAVVLKMGRFGGDSMLSALANMLLPIGFLGTALLIAAVVHQDAIPGVRQDWLARPVKRRDLLLAKFLFVVTMAQGPMMLADLMQGLANGFPVTQSFEATISRFLFLFLLLGLPLLAFASVTKDFMEAIVGGVAIATGSAIFIEVSNRGPSFHLVDGSGIHWIPEVTRFAVTSAGAVVVLALQYFYRKTLPARWLTVTAAFLWLVTFFMPWRPAFAIQQQRAPSPGSASGVALAFDPGLGRRRQEAGIPEPERRGNMFNEGDALVHLPLRVAGLPDDAVLKADHVEARLIGPDGIPQQAGLSALSSVLEVRREGRTASEKQVYHRIHIRGAVYNRLMNQNARLEIDYSLTLLRLAASHALPAVGGDQRMPGVGWCATRVNDAGTSVQLRCVEAGPSPSCGTLFLEHTPSGRRNPEISACRPDYTPYFGGTIQNAMSHFGTSLPFRDPSGLARYPVDGPQLPESQVVLRVYRPQDHFTRRLVVPDIRLKDWESE